MIIPWIDVNIVTSRLKVGIVETEDTSVARQRLGKEVRGNGYASSSIGIVWNGVFYSVRAEWF
jgi:hypothetical protein